MFYDNLVDNVIKIETDKEVFVIGKSYDDGSFNSVFASVNSYGQMVGSDKFKKDIDRVIYGQDSALVNRFEEVVDFDSYVTEAGKTKFMYMQVDSKGSFKIHRYQDKWNVFSRYYLYSKNQEFGEGLFYKYLNPPDGNNLIDIIRTSSQLRKEISKMFEPSGLKLLIRIDERRLEVIKDLDGIVHSYPYSSIADTLQRIIFYLAAIESNDDAVILFEEPEAHSYPQYVSMLGKRIAASRNNQFFVATHSPYLLTEILEQMLPDEEQASELAIFVAYYEDYQTKVRQLSDEEMRAIRGDSVDVFYNMNRYIPRPANG